MLLPLDGRRLYFDLVGPDTAPTVCFTHSLSSDSGMWAEGWLDAAVTTLTAGNAATSH
jgi:hypothetical protein